MERIYWTDERLNESFQLLRRDLAQVQSELSAQRAQLTGLIASVDAHGELLSETRKDVRELRTGLVIGFVTVVAAVIGNGAF